MWGNSLREDIKHFVRVFGVVSKAHLLRFFQDQDSHSVEYVINDMLWTHDLYDQGGGKLSTRKKLPYDLSVYNESIMASCVLCTQFRSSEILYFDNTIYPTRLIFETTTHMLYDVTVFPPAYLDWQAVLTTALLARKKTIPPGIDDVAQHIAVVWDIQSDMVKSVADFGYTIFATVDSNGNVKIYKQTNKGG